VISKEAGGMNKDELKGVVYIWGTNKGGQLGITNKFNKKLSDMEDEK